MTADAPLFRLVYVSEHALVCDDDGISADFAEIGRQSTANNSARGITGFLICARTWFAQVIEGPVESIDRLHRALAGDPRHHRLRVLERVAVDRRLFPDWHLGLGFGGLSNDLIFLSHDFSDSDVPHGRTAEEIVALALELAQVQQMTRD